MPSHHSHSGEFCNHAVDQLEDIVQEAIRQGMQTFALTEHMPRNEEVDLYPGERDSGWSLSEQAVIFERFYRKARELQKQYEDQIELLVGMEIDWIRPESQTWIESLIKKYQFDLFVGSVHHVHGIPIDFDAETYEKAVRSCEARAGSFITAEQVLFEDYFDDQYAMLIALKPPVVGHLDLIRLLSKNPDVDWRGYSTVWKKIQRNIDYIQGYGGCLELNGAALRKGLLEPYPKLEICQYFNSIGGRFVLSDDSHGIKQVGHSYEGVLAHAKAAGIGSLAVLTRKTGSTMDNRFPGIDIKIIFIAEVERMDFWQIRKT